jgi:hypothetical protein
MFGSQQLLIAFFIGVLGMSLVSFVALSKIEGSEGVLLMVGMLLIWVSSLFGGFLAGVEVCSKSKDEQKSE